MEESRRSKINTRAGLRHSTQKPLHPAQDEQPLDKLFPESGNQQGHCQGHKAEGAGLVVGGGGLTWWRGWRGGSDGRGEAERSVGWKCGGSNGSFEGEKD